jgi:hypothetical protein
MLNSKACRHQQEPKKQLLLETVGEFILKKEGKEGERKEERGKKRGKEQRMKEGKKRQKRRKEERRRGGWVAHLVDILDIDAAVISSMLQDDLLQIKEGALVFHMLPHLHSTTGPASQLLNSQPLSPLCLFPPDKNSSHTSTTKCVIQRCCLLHKARNP